MTVPRSGEEEVVSCAVCVCRVCVYVVADEDDDAAWWLLLGRRKVTMRNAIVLVTGARGAFGLRDFSTAATCPVIVEQLRSMNFPGTLRSNLSCSFAMFSLSLSLSLSLSRFHLPSTDSQWIAWVFWSLFVTLVPSLHLSLLCSCIQVARSEEKEERGEERMEKEAAEY